MADGSRHPTFSGFLQYASDDADFAINIHAVDGRCTFHGMGGIQCTAPASNANSVGIIKSVLTPRQASVICSYASVLIKPQPLTKALSKLTIDDHPKHDVVMRVAEGLDALLVPRYITQATAYPSGVEFLQSVMQNTGTSAMC